MLAIIPKKVVLLWCVCSALFFLLAADVRYLGVVSKMDRPISEAFHNLGAYKSLIFQAGTGPFQSVGLPPFRMRRWRRNAVKSQR
jgi:hypothetical protein